MYRDQMGPEKNSHNIVYNNNYINYKYIYNNYYYYIITIIVTMNSKNIFNYVVGGEWREMEQFLH